MREYFNGEDGIDERNLQSISNIANEHIVDFDTWANDPLNGMVLDFVRTNRYRNVINRYKL